ncbi:bifunctional [glutamate--ammonia ligase]-adenylyl-L-tyrosine phosphorylase/[glutamate--ammonia-ligase] adenylyltransferase [Thalassotalea ponticola]|uniref:bifunctional [glutamate--ammonia ligase]-adenylyl-L-tyrosine phosphorylase/[glutamate--ammonia-ligase] adenylyltransferase n=1 Tax=Thalassotalea ponticola TaxID=1523392 RepID=UPI0025B517D1|nr:bifunctional [glutamate--ammonia ligase]-adenylyl-L-tyrosine phosphorylase/[glutamate--ammonia-ligase] adenylyltransferase [Thalassotalea ponticola]MDN3651943.1 bifunctional [glutamate--ammonia ligase]-adenylyl-L-tyrosine phosphorylase/[glutamate--ammonia-ligase] adenylyltransferase [Thalassotalea ponticola]
MTQPVKVSLPDQLVSKYEGYYQRLNDCAVEVVQGLTTKQLEQLKQLFALSDFAAEHLLRQPDLIHLLLAELGPDFVNKVDIQQQVASEVMACQSEADLHRTLRLLRNKYMCAIAYADLCLNAPLVNCMANLSHLADSLIDAANQWLTAYCQQLWGVPVSLEGQIQPLLIYGMGKLGGQELNFSSDIDLIFCFPQNGETQGARRSIDNQTFFTKLGQKLIAALDQVTVDGFVYRVDMRLRPFGASGPLVLSFAAMESYYQEQGRDWERYAMLKARLIGNSDYHQALSNLLRPFVYRRYIDFSVIDSLRQMKMLIAQEARRRQLDDNIKLGIGGIREVEFIVQVFQLMRGGRIKALQQRNLLKALPLLVEFECLTDTSAERLKHAYAFLRRSENAIQAFADQQTQQLPNDEINRQRLCCVMGFADWDEYYQTCKHHMQAVHHEFGLLIGEENSACESTKEHWQTLWQANWQVQQACEFIASYQPHWPATDIYKALQNFQLDVNKRGLGNRGRVILDKLMPVLLQLLEGESQPLVTLHRVLQVLTKIATRTVYLELLLENLPAFNQLLSLCRSSAWIAEYLAKYPLLLDELIDPKLLVDIPTLDEYQRSFAEHMMRIPEDDLEMQMESIRQLNHAKQLKIAAADITGILPVMKVSDHLTAIAQATIAMVVDMAWQQMVHRYGQPNCSLGSNDKRFAVLGYGKLGGIELGYGSDLDLVFIHRSDPNDVTNGEKSIASSQFYLKLAQRIMHLFNTRTASGILYEVDLRLRPSGDSGLMVVHVDTFEHYQNQDAWTWEHQALTRARFVCGDETLEQRFKEIRHAVLCLPREPQKLAADVIDMRRKMRAHLDKSNDSVIDIKQGPGGLADIEFFAQFMILQHSHNYPKLTEYSDNVRMFSSLAEQGLISEQQANGLIDAYCTLRHLGHSLTLQNQALVIDHRQLSELCEVVEQCWRHYLLSYQAS